MGCGRAQSGVVKVQTEIDYISVKKVVTSVVWGELLLLLLDRPSAYGLLWLMDEYNRSGSCRPFESRGSLV